MLPARLRAAVAPALVMAGVTASAVAPHHQAHLAAATVTREVRVAVVIDFGPHSGMVPRVVIRCERVPRGTSGATVIAKVASDLRVPQPTYAVSGLLCSIDGYPTSGCGTQSGGGYAYWSYWHGGPHWSYADVGPAEWTVADDDVEGWRYEDPGTASPSDPHPDAPSAYAAACALEGAATTPAPTAGTASGSAGGDVVLGGAIALIGVLVAASVTRWRRRPAA